MIETEFYYYFYLITYPIVTAYVNVKYVRLNRITSFQV